MQQSCSCRDRNVLCRDTAFVATSFSCFSVSGNYFNINFFVTTFFLLFFSNFVAIEFPYVATELLWLLNNLYSDRIFFCRDRIFFSCPYRWLSCLLRHRNLCCDRLDLANLSSLSISVATEFSSVTTEFYHSVVFIVEIGNFFVTTKILPSILYYVTT